MRFVGEDENGRAFTVSSPSQLDFEMVGETLRITRGVDVEFSIEGEDGFFARCARLSDLDLGDMTAVWPRQRLAHEVFVGIERVIIGPRLGRHLEQVHAAVGSGHLEPAALEAHISRRTFEQVGGNIGAARNDAVCGARHRG